MEICCERYGHKATFFSSDSISPSQEALVSWDRCEIAVPSGSVLDTRAIVRLQNVGATEPGARSWCRSNRAKFIAVDERTGSVTFEVAGFSRYRYVDSDSDEEEILPEKDDQVTPARTPHRSAGRTPYRRGRTMAAVSPSDSDDSKTPDATPTDRNADVGTDSTPRPGSRITAIDADVETTVDNEDTKSNLTSSVQMDDDPIRMIPRSIVPPAIQSAQFWSRNSHGPNITRTRNALFHDSVPLLPSQQHHIRNHEDTQLDSHPVDATHVTVYDNEDDMDVVIPTPLKQVKRQVRFSDVGVKASPASEVDLEADAEMMDITGSTPAKLPATADQQASRFALAQQQLPFPSLKNSRFSGNEGCYDDLCLALGRSFRVGFSNSDGVALKPVFAQVGNTKGFYVDEHHFFQNDLDKFERSHFFRFLRTHLTSWKEQDMQTIAHGKQQDDSLEPVYMSENPKQNLNPNSRRIKVPNLKSVLANEMVADGYLCALIDELKSDSDTDENCKYNFVLFGLVQALTKSSEGQGRTGSEDNLLSRLSDWALGPAGTIFDEPIPSEPSLRKALLLMTNGNVELAAEAAIEAGHIRLGLLIARGLESPKDVLREDAEAQLMAYNLTGTEIDEMKRQFGDNDNMDDDFEDECAYSVLDAPSPGAISVDEKMILLLLSGRVAPVARYLKLSWYRVFIMELIHGSGCCDMPQENRVTAAVQSIAEWNGSVCAPHGKSKDIDAAYHLLRLLSNSTTSYPITSGLFSPRSIGFKYAPLDTRFSWFLYQVLSSLVPRACNSTLGTKNVAWKLAEDFAMQLFASKLPLWAFYVLCSGSPPEETLKCTLIKKWPELSVDCVEWNVGGESTVTRNSDDGVTDIDIDGDDAGGRNNHNNHVSGHMGAEPFLVSVLGVPAEWIHEAKAVMYHYEGDAMNECEEWMWTRTSTGINKAHTILVHQIFPKALSLYKTYELVMVRKHLAQLASSTANCNIIGWSTQGGLVLDYLTYIADIPDLKKPIDMNLLRSMALRVPALETAATSTNMKSQGSENNDLMNFVTQKIADDIIAAQRAALIVSTGNGETEFDNLLTDLENMPTSDVTRKRIAQERRYVGSSSAVASRFASAHPMYYRHVADALEN